MEGLTDAGNKEKVKEICTQYGEVVEVQLPQSLGSKRKYFGFITFTSQESALACVEGINNAHIGQEVKVVKCYFFSFSFFSLLRETIFLPVINVSG